MKSLTRIATGVILLCLLSLTAQAQTGAEQVSEFDVNGLKVLVKRRPGTASVAVGLFFRGGVRNLTPQNAGLEALTLSVAAEASKNFPRQRLRKETSSVGTVISAGSTYDHSVLALGCTKAAFDRSWEIFTDVALDPAFTPEDVERLREARLTALRSESDSPEGALESLSRKVAFAGHPYASPPEGTVATLTSFKAADLAGYHKQLLQTSRLLLVVVGDVEPAALQKRVAASLGKLPRGTYADAPVKRFDYARASLEIVQKPVQTNYVKGTFAAPSIAEPDYYAMRAAIALLQSYVFQEVRVKRNLSYAPDADMNSFAANTASISVSSVSPNDAINVMLGEIKKLRRGQIAEDELKRMAAFFLTTHFLKLETNAAQTAELAQYELYGGGWRRSIEFLDKIRAVKPADVQAAAERYMRNLQFSVVGDTAAIDRSIFLQKD